MAAEKEKLSLKAEAYIRDKIINGELQANDKIIETDVAKALGISRGPIREALKVLVFEGLVDYEANKGCSVTTLLPVDAYEIFFMRGSLEKIALERCGGKIPDEFILKMEVALDNMDAAIGGKLSDIIDADEMFHTQIVESGHMSRLTKMWKMLSPLNGAMFLTVNNAKKHDPEVFSSLDPSNRYYRKYENVYESHRMLFEVLKEGNLRNSCECLDAHYELIGKKIYRSYLKDETR